MSKNEGSPLIQAGEVESPLTMITPFEPPSTGRNPQNSYKSTSFLIVGTMAGGGVLGIPGGLLSTGYTGVALLVVCCVVANITAQLLGGMLQRMPQNTVRDYASIGGAAFGKYGVVATNVTQYFTLTGVNVIFLVLSGLLLNTIVPTVPAKFFTMCVGVLMMAVMFILPALKEATWSSYLAVVATQAATIFAVVLSLIFYFSDNYELCTDCQVHSIIEPTFAAGFGVFSFAFGGHSLLPNFYAELKHPSHWFRATQLAYWGTLLLMYLPMGVVGYLVYGAATDSQILSSIALLDPSTATATKIVSAIVIAHLATALPIVMTPVLERIERSLIKNKRYRKTRSLPKLIVRVLGIAGMTLIAVLVPYFLNLISIVSALSITCDVYLFPAIFYWKLRNTTVLQKIGLILILLFGLAGSVTSLIDAVPALISAIRCGGNPFGNFLCFGNASVCPAYCPPLDIQAYCNVNCTATAAELSNLMF